MQATQIREPGLGVEPQPQGRRAPSGALTHREASLVCQRVRVSQHRHIATVGHHRHGAMPFFVFTLICLTFKETNASRLGSHPVATEASEGARGGAVLLLVCRPEALTSPASWAKGASPGSGWAHAGPESEPRTGGSALPSFPRGPGNVREPPPGWMQGWPERQVFRLCSRDSEAPSSTRVLLFVGFYQNEWLL